MDAFLKALETRGFSGEVSKDSSRSTYAVVRGEKVRIHLWEKDNRTERELTKGEQSRSSHIYDRWIFTPSGKLTFTIDEHWDECRRKNWTDKLQKPLEDQLNEVMMGIITAAEALRLRKLRWQEEERLRREETIRREEARRRQQEEVERRKSLELQAESWIKSQNLLAFLQNCEALIIDRAGSITPGSPEAKWLQWAYHHAAGLDPLTNGSFEDIFRRNEDDANL